MSVQPICYEYTLVQVAGFPRGNQGLIGPGLDLDAVISVLRFGAASVRPVKLGMHQLSCRRRF